MLKFFIMAFTAATLSACTSFSAKTDTETKSEASAQAGQSAASKAPIAGGYGNERALTEMEQAFFNSMTSGLKGVVYTADSVATQVVAGLNYRFVCNAKTIAPEPKTYRMEIIVYQPLPNHGEPWITSLKRL